MDFEKEKEEQLHDERYDRTIRALTAEVALKIMKSRVAITPLNGINTEFMKNIILDGSNVTIFDDSIVNEDDLETNFMLSPDDLNKNKGEILKAKFNEMNPYAKIEAKALLKVSDLYQAVVVEDKKEILKEFDVLAVSTTLFDEMILWDKISIHLNKPLYILNCCGFYGFTWINVGRNFTYISVKPKTEVYNFVDGEYKKVEEEVKDQFEDITINSESLESCLDPSKKNKTAIYYAINMMYRAQKQNLFYDPFNPNEEVLNQIVDIGKKIYTDNKLKTNETTFDTLRNFAKMYGVQYCPTYSVIGSVTSQEFTKTVARNAEPAMNWFCYDSQVGYGKVDCIQDTVYQRKPHNTN